MGRRYDRNTKGKIVEAAWKLFNEQGYDHTTIEDIVETSGTSRGSFYHYFESKDSVIAAMSFVIDDEYKNIAERIPEEYTAYEALLFLNSEICRFMENKLAIEPLSRLFASQLTTSGERIMSSRDRYYYRLVRKIIDDGITKGELSDEFTVNEIMNAYALLERGLIFDWILCSGEYNLMAYSQQLMPVMMRMFLPKDAGESERRHGKDKYR